MITHKVQLNILSQLLFKPQSHFTDLNKTGLESDHFTFHLNKLIKEGLVEKNNGLYNLSSKGLEFAGRINTSLNQVILQPKVSVMVYVSRKKHGRKEVLLGERLTDPIKGKISCQTTKVKLGETLQNAAVRCLEDETGLVGNINFVGVFNYQHFKNGEPLEMAVINCFRVGNVSGKLKYQNSKVKNFWIPFEEALKLENVYAGFGELLELFSSKKFFLKEIAVREKISLT